MVKRTSFYDYRVTNRGGKGIIGIINSSRNGNVVASSFPVKHRRRSYDYQLIKVGLSDVAVKEIRSAGRNTHKELEFLNSQDQKK